MNARELAAEICLMPHHKRDARLQTIPYPLRADVEQHMRNMEQRDEVGTRRRGKGKHPWDRSMKRGV